jgi:hypothetical protein
LFYEKALTKERLEILPEVQEDLVDIPNVQFLFKNYFRDKRLTFMEEETIYYFPIMRMKKSNI